MTESIKKVYEKIEELKRTTLGMWYIGTISDFPKEIYLKLLTELSTDLLEVEHDTNMQLIEADTIREGKTPWEN